MARNLLALFAAAVLIGGCANMNDALTPSLIAERDRFDGAATLTQPPVRAASSIAEPAHLLGFDWNEKSPDKVFLTVEADGISNITDLQFNADGRMLAGLSQASAVTDHRTSKYGSWSIRRFAVPWDDFLIIAHANSVKMKVVYINDYTVSSFNPCNPSADVDFKFARFVAAVSQARASASSGK